MLPPSICRSKRERRKNEARMYFSGDQCFYVLTRRTVVAAGQQFFCRTGAPRACASAFLHRATGRQLDEPARALCAALVRRTRGIAPDVATRIVVLPLQ